jgi:hypothetical protein
MVPNAQLELDNSFAWNHICVTLPRNWEVDSLDNDHVLIGDRQQPKIELKWTESPKRFTLEKFLKKFIAQVQRQLDIHIHEHPSPDHFSHPNPHLNFFFFSWNGHGEKGVGTLIFCQHCKRLTLFRFFKINHIDPLCRQVLLSFSDHPEKDQARWSVFGFDALAPAAFKLKDYSFKPGAFQIELVQKKTRLIYYSWGPAAFLLEKSDLGQFARQRLPQISGLATTGKCAAGNYLQWEFEQNRFKNAHLIPVLKRFSLFSLFRLCHDTKKNRLLGTMAVSPLPAVIKQLKGSIFGDI